MSLSIVEFLNARLDAREAGARELLDYHAEARVGGVGATIWDDQDAEARDVLAEVAAHRKLIEAHIGYYGAGDDEHWPVSVLTILGERYGYDANAGWGEDDHAEKVRLVPVDESLDVW